MLSPLDIETILQDRETEAQAAAANWQMKAEVEAIDGPSRPIRSALARALLELSLKLDRSTFESRAEAAVSG
jgi:hypothetical protein